MAQQSTIQDFKLIIHDQFMVEYPCDNEIIDKAINSIFHFFQSGNFTKFKVEINLISDELLGLQIVAKDAAFIVDSTMNVLQKNGCEIVFMSIPVLYVERNNDGILKSFSTVEQSSNNNEAISLFVFKGGIQAGLEQLKIDVEQVLECVFAANESWLSSQAIVKSILDIEQDEQYKKFFEWLLGNNFIFLATCNGDWNGKIENLSGLLSTEYYNYNNIIDFNIGKVLRGLPNQKVIFNRTTLLSKVHRNANMDVIYVRNSDNTQFIALIGFFTSAVYHQNVMDIPIIHDKIRSALAKHTRLIDSGYVRKEVIAQMQEYPRTELFQMNDDDLYSLIHSIISVILLPRVKIFVREDITSSFKSLLIFIPQEKFSMDLYSQIERIIREKMSVIVFKKYIHMSEGRIMNVQLIVKQIGNSIYNLVDIEKAVESVTLSWHDLLREGLYKQYKHYVASIIFELFTSGFPPEYIASHKPNDAIDDISVIYNIGDQDKVCKFLVEDNEYHFRIYSKEYKLEVSDLLPAIENAGFAVTDMITYKITLKSNLFFIHKIDVRPSYNINIQSHDTLKYNLELLIGSIISNRYSDDDRFNSLILYCGLSYREVLICRIYASYTKQLALQFDIDHIIDALVDNGLLTRRLVDLFNQKFSKIGIAPKDLATEYLSIKKEILSILDQVDNALHDSILRRYLLLIDATKRTNFFCNNEYVSLKIASTEVPFAPLPKPFMEIFVYSNRFEGIHLRGGKIARGGIRWSDRHMDFRTEVLGLMKAQMTKNSVIVPVGSKGGFIVKHISPKNKEAFLEAGIECYKVFLRGLLDITDNFIGSNIVETKNSVCWDDLDPYLVVAADKGTATFSDYANAMALEYDFWLGDAFASGGSAGYDHKKLAITSRGAWISVLQHFKMLGINPNEDKIYVVGIGDMSGDVFGNGLLLSHNICLIGAFNHIHIFIDPEPEPYTSYNERKRLFEQPRSQWSDYDIGLISKGGGIFLRSAKSIELNQEIRSALGIDPSITSMTPDDLIKSILKSPVDLMWNGGIGTYVKSSLESNEEIGDKGNDNLRVNGKDLRCKVVGEGGNLGFTQLGRIEYANIGGYINTDAIDNSGGVDCSDHEVNLKIGFSRMLSDGAISLENRNRLLESMSSEICELVLQDNRLQNHILSVELSQGKENIAEHAWLVDHLEKSGELNRDVEKLPSQDEFRRMIANKHCLTRPELAILLAYAKNSTINILSNIEGIDDMLERLPYKDMYLKYFPHLLRDNPEYLEYLLKHRLSKEILITVIVNDLINTMGCTYFSLRVARQGMSPIKLIKAFCIVKYGLKIDETLAILDKSTLSGKEVLILYKLLQSIIARNIAWISHGQIDEIDANNKLYQGISTAVSQLITSLDCNDDSEIDFIKNMLGVDEISSELKILSHTIAVQRFALDIFFASKKYSVDLVQIAKAYRLIHVKLRFNLLYKITGEVFDNLHYESKIATMIVVRSLNALLMKLTVTLLESIRGEEGSQPILDKLDEISTNDSGNKYFEFINEIYDCSTQDIVSLLLLLKSRLKAMLNTIRNQLLRK